MASQTTVLPNCDICNGQYDTVKRIPIFLRCFHTFCLLCLQYEETEDAVIKCRSCFALTSIDVDNEFMGLEINEKIMARLEQPTSATAKSSGKKVNKGPYFWCLKCDMTVEKETDCVESHMIIDLEKDEGKKMADNHFRKILGTYKSQLSGHLKKYLETDSALEAIESALEALMAQASFRKEENDREIREIKKELLLVTDLLDELPEKIHQNGEDVHTSHQEYRDLVKKTNFTETTDFDLIRNNVVKMDIKSLIDDKSRLIPPLCHSDLIINFPSVGATELETHLLTTLSFLLLLSSQKEGRVTAIRPRKKSDTPKKPFQTKSVEKKWRHEKEEAARKEFESKKPLRTVTRHASDVGTLPKAFVYNKANHSRPYTNQRTYGAEQQVCDDRSHWQEPSNEQAAPKRKPMQVAFQESHQIPAPVTIPSLMSLKNKKAFLALAVNGMPYGNIVIELRPDVAPIMCQKFLERCTIKNGPPYQGTIIYQSKPKTFIMGGKTEQESLYMADVSPLRKDRGAIFFRLKRDYVKTQCSIVSTDFCIHLGDESPDNHRTSTVFGYVCDGLAVCDAISYLDCSNRDHVAISSTGFVG